MKAYVGVDWSATQVVCSTATETGRVKRIAGCGRGLDDVRDLVRRIRERHEDATEVHVLIEAGSPGWVRLFDAADTVVYVADPKQAKRFAESLCSSGAKDDGRDSATLTQMLQSPSHRPKPWSGGQERELLERLATSHEQLSKDLVRYRQQLRAVLREHMPLVEEALKDLTTQWARALLQRVPTPWHARDLGDDELEQLLGRAREPRRTTVKQAMSRTEAPWLTEALAQVEGQRVRQLLERINLLMAHLTEADKAIDDVTSQLPARPILESMEGIGLRQSATLLQFAFSSELLHRDHAGVQLGACPVFMGSGQRADGTPKGTARMRRAAHHRGRRATYLLGRLATQHHAWAKAMFLDGRGRGQSAATAYRRVARSVLRILTAMVRNNVPYDEVKYVAALQARGVPWATKLTPSP